MPANLRDAGRKGGQVGVAIARELLEAVRPRIAGAYIIPAFGRYDVVAEVLEGLPLPPGRVSPQQTP